MGITKLGDLAEAGDDGLAAAANVLRFELADGCWKSKDEFQESYPQSTIQGDRARIFLDDVNAVDLRFNFATGMMLIEGAGRVSRPSQGPLPRGEA
ncbi:hypothetical protein ELI55_27020 (plasmid) [Rhizobium ruizarguesonis]|nr:hypothetical protein ELI55_27020 [Rhizobium ruizarguesonis]